MTRIFAILLLGLISFGDSAHAFNKPNKTPQPAMSTNTHFCRCDTVGESFGLIRVDISEGKKHETKVREYPKGAFTLIQCEDAIAQHPSCKK